MSQRALRPPLTTADMREQVAPVYVGEHVVDDETGEPFYARKVGDTLQWERARFPSGAELGAVLLAAEDGAPEAASVYPVLLNQLTLSFRSAAATILALHHARSK